MNKSLQRGGARKGAGRPMKYNEPPSRHTIRIPESFAVEMVKKYGSIQKWIDAQLQRGEK